jgi:hypothetical protein
MNRESGCAVPESSAGLLWSWSAPRLKLSWWSSLRWSVVAVTERRIQLQQMLQSLRQK